MNFDIVIVGGGLVGATLACALKDLPLRVALVDSQPQAPSNDARLIALNYGSVELLKKISVFEKLLPFAGVIEQVHVSRRGQFGATRIHARELKLPTLGYVVPAKEINAALEQALLNTSIEIIRPATVIGLTQTEQQACLTLKINNDEKRIQGKIIIAADGTHSTLRDLLAISTETQEYDQSAIVTVTTLARPHQQVAYERFLADGALAMLPLAGNQCATIWTASNAQVAHLMQLSDELFLAALQQEFGYRLGRLQSVAHRAIYPLQFMRAQKRVEGRVMLVGNAAHTVHPLAAQGLNLALNEVKALVQQLGGKPIDQVELASLDQYSLGQKVTMQLSHCLNTLFSIDFLPVNIVRQLGMIGLDISGAIKRQVAAFPAGL